MSIIFFDWLGSLFQKKMKKNQHQEGLERGRRKLTGKGEGTSAKLVVGKETGEAGLVKGRLVGGLVS